MLARLGSRVADGVISVTVDESRSQWRNRSLARRRLAELLTEATKTPAKRRPTKPTRASKRRRLEHKRAQGEKKRLRRPPEY
jgi:ribosome-associated protein